MAMENSDTLLKIAALLLVLHACYATYLHRTERITIYSSYTDAAMTGFSPVAALAVYLLLTFMDVPEQVAAWCGVGILALAASVVVRHTWKANGSVLCFLSALLAKYTVLVLYYLFMLLVLLGSGNRRKYERRSTASRRNAAALAATTAAYVGWAMWVTREPGFVPVREYLALD